MKMQVRIARPVKNIQRSIGQYTAVLGLQLLGIFSDHDGFDGAMIGRPGEIYHFEFTVFRNHPIAPRTTPEDLCVFYLPDTKEWGNACAAMSAAGFKEVRPFNPYWRKNGRTFHDYDGYHVVLQCASWDDGKNRL